MSERKLFAVIGCSKEKAKLKRLNTYGDDWIEAKDLYVSDLFKKRMAHVEARKIPWFIASAGSGLVAPTTPMRTYDKTIADMEAIDRSAWYVGVASELIDRLYYDHDIRDLRDVAIELHAGADYCEPLDKILELLGAEVIRPVKGLGIGQQLAYYSQAGVGV